MMARGLNAGAVTAAPAFNAARNSSWTVESSRVVYDQPA